MDTELDLVDIPYRPAKAKLTVEHVAALLRKNYNQAQIAKLSNVSPQAVNQFIETHYDVLHPLVDNTDTVLALRLKAKAIEIANTIDGDDIKKASLMQKATATGIFIDKYRLLSGQSTANVEWDIALRRVHANLFQPAKEEIKAIDIAPAKKTRRKR